MSWWSWCWV